MGDMRSFANEFAVFRNRLHEGEPIFGGFEAVAAPTDFRLAGADFTKRRPRYKAPTDSPSGRRPHTKSCLFPECVKLKSAGSRQNARYPKAGSMFLRKYGGFEDVAASADFRTRGEAWRAVSTD